MVFEWFVLSMRMQVILDSSFARPGSAGFRDWTIHAEAYHLEASKFSLYVGNNAGVFHPTNQSHGIFFAQIWNQRIELRLFK